MSLKACTDRLKKKKVKIIIVIVFVIMVQYVPKYIKSHHLKLKAMGWSSVFLEHNLRMKAFSL